jgi:hypothetical protein
MNSEIFKRHFEPLISGTITSVLIFLLAGKGISINNSVVDSQFIISIVFIAIAYTVGVFVILASRFIVRLLSMYLRPMLLRLKYKSDLIGKSRKEINEEYQAAYMDAILIESKIKNTSIKVRRERARITRSSSLPAMLFILYVFRESLVINILLLELTTYFVIVIIFVYSEMSVYEEAKRIITLNGKQT